MAMQPVIPFAYPGIQPAFSGGASPNVGANSTQLNGSGDYESVVFTPTEPFTVTAIGFLAGTVNTPGTVTVSIQGLSSGNPDGAPITDDLGGSASKTSATISTALSWTKVTLDNPVTLNQGEDYAAVIAWASGDLFTCRVANFTLATAKPYTVVSTGTPGKSDLKTNIAIYGSTKCLRLYSYTPCSGTTFSPSYNNTSSPDELGLRFRLPFKARIKGMLFQFNSGGPFEIYLSDDAGNELGNTLTAADPANRRGLQLHGWFPFDNSHVVDANTWYRAWMRPSSTTNTHGLYYATLDEQILKTAWPYGADWNWCERTNGDTPSDINADRLPLVDLIIDQLDDGVESGGGGSGGGLKIVGPGGLAA